MRTASASNTQSNSKARQAGEGKSSATHTPVEPAHEQRAHGRQRVRRGDEEINKVLEEGRRKREEGRRKKEEESN
ncbi:hypothetical protein [Microcoleus sp.]|uniref:hypothetical protein n=1 Tax=Microcoleus sp. TaxID=44472 RepID=UPI003592F5CB